MRIAARMAEAAMRRVRDLFFVVLDSFVGVFDVESAPELGVSWARGLYAGSDWRASSAVNGRS